MAWTAELWIPFSQLRFSRQSEQVWGLNIRRFRPTLDEEDYWVLDAAHRALLGRRASATFAASAGVRPTRRIEAAALCRRRVDAERRPRPATIRSTMGGI